MLNIIFFTELNNQTAVSSSFSFVDVVVLVLFFLVLSALLQQCGGVIGGLNGEPHFPHILCTISAT
jgi:hypothetical protein